MDDRSPTPEWTFDRVEAAVSPLPGTQGLPGVSMRVSRGSDGGLQTFMLLDQAKHLRDALDAAIAAAERAENNPPAALYGNVE